MGKSHRHNSFFVVISVIFLLGPWLVSFAYGDVGDDSGQAGVSVESATVPALPTLNVFGQAIGGVTSGDLFYIDARNSSGDILVNLYITNAYELTHHLRYLILKVSVYCEDEDGNWIKTIPQGVNPAADTCITLRNSPVDFYLPGLARYKISVDYGSYYCITAAENSADVSPQFYLAVEPA